MANGQIINPYTGKTIGTEKSIFEQVMTGIQVKSLLRKQKLESDNAEKWMKLDEKLAGMTYTENEDGTLTILDADGNELNPNNLGDAVLINRFKNILDLQGNNNESNPNKEKTTGGNIIPKITDNTPEEKIKPIPNETKRSNTLYGDKIGMNDFYRQGNWNNASTPSILNQNPKPTAENMNDFYRQGNWNNETSSNRTANGWNTRPSTHMDDYRLWNNASTPSILNQNPKPIPDITRETLLNAIDYFRRNQ